MPSKVAVVSRVDAAIKAALEQLAKEDGRSLSGYVERLLIAHLKAKGRLATKKPG